MKRLMLAALTVLSLAGCGAQAPAAVRSAPAEPTADSPTDVVFTVTGKGTSAAIVYSVDGRSVVLTNVRLPWRKTLPIPTGDPYGATFSLLADQTVAPPNVACTITARGVRIAHEVASGYDVRCKGSA